MKFTLARKVFEGVKQAFRDKVDQAVRSVSCGNSGSGKPIRHFFIGAAILVAIGGGGILFWGGWFLFHFPGVAMTSHVPFGWGGVLAGKGVGALLLGFAVMIPVWFNRMKGETSNFSQVSRGDVFWLLGGAGAILLFWGKVWGQGQLPLTAMTFHYFFPLQHLFSEALQKGSLFLWNPWCNGGIPGLADSQIGAFYPPNLLLFVKGYTSGLPAWIMLHHGLLFGFTYLWFRSRGVFTTNAGLGAILVSFNAYSVWHADHMTTFAGMVWFPVIIWMLEERRWELYAMGVALQVLSGHPHFHYMTMMAVGLSLVFERAAWKKWCLMAVWTALAYACVAVQILPTAELVSSSVGMGGYAPSAREFAGWGVGQWLKMWFAPLWIYQDFTLRGDPGINGFYVGVVAWALVLASLQRVRSSFVHWGWTCLLLGAVFSLGGSTPAHLWFHALIPGFKLFRNPGQWQMLAVFGVAALAVHGAQEVRPRWKTLAAGILVVELGLFHFKPFLRFVPEEFFHQPSAWASRVRRHGGRIMTTKGVDLWLSRFLEDRMSPLANWKATRDFLLLSQGMAYHVPEIISLPIYYLTPMARWRNLYWKGLNQAAEVLDVGFEVGGEMVDGNSVNLQIRQVGEKNAAVREADGSPVALTKLERTVGFTEAALLFPREGDGPVFVSQPIYRGWSVFSGGEKRSSGNFFNAFPGVELKAGDRHLLLRYDPLSVAVGGIVSVLSLAGVFSWLSRRSPNKDGMNRSMAILLGIVGFALVGAGAGLFGGTRPASRFFSSTPWEFVSRAEWLRFQLTCVMTGLIGIMVGWFGVKGTK